MRAAVFLTCLQAIVAVAGCSSSVARPNWLNPGEIGYQRQQALRYDPYPEDDLGPPIVGGRPREYDRPREPAPLKPNPLFGTPGGVAPPVQLQPTPGAYSPGAYTPAPAATGPYPQTPYATPTYSGSGVAPAPTGP